MSYMTNPAGIVSKKLRNGEFSLTRVDGATFLAQWQGDKVGMKNAPWVITGHLADQPDIRVGNYTKLEYGKDAAAKYVFAGVTELFPKGWEAAETSPENVVVITPPPVHKVVKPPKAPRVRKAALVVISQPVSVLPATPTQYDAVLIAAVKSHAIKNYERDGWDLVVECWSDADIGKVIAEAMHEKHAIQLMRRAFSPVVGTRSDALSAGR